MQTGNRKQVFNEINITPLTDIFLVLLIIMMVVAPLVHQMRADVKPPEIASGTQVEQNRLTVEVTSDGAVYVEGVEASPDNLAETLKDQQAKLESRTGKSKAASVASDASSTVAVAATPDTEAQPEEKNLVIRADKATKSGQVLKIFAAARDAGFTKVTVSGEPLSGTRQNELQQATPTDNMMGGNS